MTFKKLKLSDYPPADNSEDMLDWEAAPVGQTKLSDPLTRANYDALCDRLDAVDPYGNDWEHVKWPHWKVGWHEVIFVRPDSECAKVADQTRTDMSQYPCLDEGLWGQYEAMEASLKLESGNHD